MSVSPAASQLEVAPAWFTAWAENEVRKMTAKDTAINSLYSRIVDALADVGRQVLTLADRILEHETRIIPLENVMADISVRIDAMESNRLNQSPPSVSHAGRYTQLLRDECEILLTSLPNPSLRNSPNEEVNAFLSAIGLNRIVSSVL